MHNPRYMTVEQIRARLSTFPGVEYEEGAILRKQLGFLAKKNYVPQHTNDEYMSWLCSSAHVTFNKVHAQDMNFPFVWRLFHESCQHVYGDCLQECLDKAMAATEEKPPNGGGLLKPPPSVIRAAREHAKLTQKQAAALIDVSTRTWQDWEAGRRQMHYSYFCLFNHLRSDANVVPIVQVNKEQQ